MASSVDEASRARARKFASLHLKDWLIWLSLGLFTVGGITEAWSQAVPLPSLPRLDPSGRSAEPPPLEKEQPLAPKPSPLVPTPAPPAREQEREQLPSIQVFVREIRLTGNTVFTDDELAEVTEPYLNRTLTSEDLEGVRLALTLHYVNHGYVTSGAIIPDQPVVEGTITILIVEGKLSTIDIEGTEYFRPSYFEKRIALAAGPPVRITTLQERLQLLQQDPRIERINAELRPGVLRGESELDVKVQERRPYNLWAEFNNFQPPSVGAERGLGTITHENLTGNADTFSFTYGLSRGLRYLVDTFYTLPFTPYDTALTGSYRRNQFSIIEAPFDVLDFETESEIIGLTLRQPLYRTLNHQLTLAVTGEYLYNKITWAPFGTPKVAFNSPGFQNGVAQVSALRFVPQWVYRDSTTVLAVRSRFSVGVDVLDATVGSSGPNEPDGQFFAWLAQIQAVRRFDQWWGSQLVGRFDIQLADDRLFPLEQYPVGGRFTVRGYRENTFVRDNALIASLEARVPVLRSVQHGEIFRIATFLDYGSSWNSKDQIAPDPSDRGFLASWGLGLRWNLLPGNQAFFEIYWGVKLNYIDQGDNNALQDNGIHLQAVVRAF